MRKADVSQNREVCGHFERFRLKQMFSNFKQQCNTRQISSQPNEIKLLSSVKFCALGIFDHLLKDTTLWFRNYKLLNISVRFVFYINT